MRYFNTEGVCRPDIHYMVQINDRLAEIKRLYVDPGKYFLINRGRQYGKTTTLRALAKYLKNDYLVWTMDFQMMSSAAFADEQTFVVKFIGNIERLYARKPELIKATNPDAFQALAALKSQNNIFMDSLFEALSRICETAQKPIVMIIDEVDSASNNQVFLDFLALIRGYYLDRENSPALHSVILAGVYDIKNLKLKIRPDDDHKYNSPWNIAANFNIEMSFSVAQTKSMLDEYEADHHTGMDIMTVAIEIIQYTSGYPYLVSMICKILDEMLPESKRFPDPKNIWTKEGVTEAVKILLNMKISFFDSVMKQLDTFADMRNTIEDILYQGKKIPFSPDIKSINIGLMFGFLKEKDSQLTIANRIFEMRMLNMFLAEEAIKSEAFRQGERIRSQFVKNAKLDMVLVLAKFVEYFHDIYNEKDNKFVEAYGRKFFLLYLKPIINGTGNYYIEAQTRDTKRTDVVVDYLGEQFVIEMKIWHGNEYNQRGRLQLADYLDYFHQKKGYMLSFNFNKKKKTGMKTITLGDKTIIEAIV